MAPIAVQIAPFLQPYTAPGEICQATVICCCQKGLAFAHLIEALASGPGRDARREPGRQTSSAKNAIKGAGCSRYSTGGRR